MQSASSNFAQAMSGSAVTWAPSAVYADWAGDGYGAANSIDDLSGQVGQPLAVKHHLDDGLPDEVSFVSGLGVGELSVPLDFGRAVSGVPLNAGQYFSPFRSDSPVYSYDRDVAPVRADVRAVTAGGVESVTIFTGQMVNIPVDGQRATLQAMSAARLKLSKLIQPPAIDASPMGLTATWPISYALATCGIYVSPPPRTGCRLWIPMHSSIMPFSPDANTVADSSNDIKMTPTGWKANTTSQEQFGPGSIDGPYLTSLDCYLTATESVRATLASADLASGSDLISQAGSAGRVEFWVRGDTAETASPPAGIGGAVSKLAGFAIGNEVTPGSGFSTEGYVECGIGTDRKAYVTVDDGVNVSTLKSSGTLPTDGAWYFVGCAWDIANNKLWVRLDTTATSSTPSPAMTITHLPLADAFDRVLGYPGFVSYVPTAEVQLTGGVQANPDNYPWLPDVSWTTGAVIRPSQLPLVVLAETKPREAWELIASYAQAEMAALRTDELDLVRYLPRSYWAETAQQTVVDTLSTRRNAADLAVTYDPSKVRNSVRVSYTETQLQDLNTSVYTAQKVIEVPAGSSTLTVALQYPAVTLDSGPMAAWSGATLSGSSDYLRGAISHFTANSARDGSGTYYVYGEVTATIVAWTPGEATIQFSNLTGVVAYLANDVNLPGMAISGLTPVTAEASATSSDDLSVETRGERALAITLSTIQDRVSATQVANRLRSELSQPVAVLNRIEVFGDPRRQPGDLVTVADSDGTGASGSWRLQSIEHKQDGAEYTQSVTVRKAKLVGKWGDGVSKWGQIIWK